MNLPLELHLAGRTGRSHHFPNYRAANHKILFIFHVEFADYFAFHFIGFFLGKSKMFSFHKIATFEFSVSLGLLFAHFSSDSSRAELSITAYFMIYWPVVVLVSKKWSPYLPSTTCRLCMICFRTEYQINVK